jgi:hypothetical protein
MRRIEAASQHREAEVVATILHINSSQWDILKALNTEAHQLKDAAACLRHSKAKEDPWVSSRTHHIRLHAVLLWRIRCQVLRTWVKPCLCSNLSNMEATPSTTWADHKYTTPLLQIILPILSGLGKARTRSKSSSRSLSLTNSQTGRGSHHESSSVILFQAMGRSIQSAPSGAFLNRLSFYPPFQNSFLYLKELQR